MSSAIVGEFPLSKMEDIHKQRFMDSAGNYFARKAAEAALRDEVIHLNFGEVWLKENFAMAKAELEVANSQNLPLVWAMLNQVEEDIKTIGIDKNTIGEEFMSHYGEALSNIGFNTCELMKMSCEGLTVI